MTKQERDGATRIADERKRQIEKEGWTPDHDDLEHVEGELALAAICYAAPEPIFVHRSFNVDGSDHHFVDPWPEEWDQWDKRPAKKPTDAQRIRMLEKAGALCAAEIDRLLRKTEEKR